MRLFYDASSSTRELIALINLRIAKRVLIKKEFSNFSPDDMLYNQEPCMGCGLIQIWKSVFWSSPPLKMFTFNVDGATKGKPGPARIKGVLHNYKGQVLFMFSKFMMMIDPLYFLFSKNFVQFLSQHRNPYIQSPNPIKTFNSSSKLTPTDAQSQTPALPHKIPSN